MNNFITTKEDVTNPFWHQIKDLQVFCRFNVIGETKFPIDLQGNRGIGANASLSALGTYEDIEPLERAFLGISLMRPIMVGEMFLVCLDFDWKRSPTGKAEPEQLELMTYLLNAGCAYETSWSGKGCHIWTLMTERNIPKSIKLQNNCEIEVFSGFEGQRSNVLITDYDFEGALQPFAFTMPKGIEPPKVEKPVQPITITSVTPDVIKMLDMIPSDDYATWIQVGMILKSEHGEDGYEVWDLWSKKSENYDPFAMGSKWASFKGQGLTKGSLVKIAREYGYEDSVREKSSAVEDFGIVDQVTGEIKFTNPWESRFTDIPEKLTPPDWLIDGFLADKLTIIAGSPGVGKTSCIVPMALTVAGIASHLSDIQAKHHRHVIYLSEDIGQVHRIIFGMIKHCVLHNGMKVTHNMIAERFHSVHTARSTPEQLALLALLCDQYAVYDGDIRLMPLVVLDTASATFALDSENDNAEVAKYVATIKETFLRRDIPVWVIAHTPKALKRADVRDMSARGASAWEGDANAVAYIFEEEGLKERFMSLGKHRYESVFNEVAIDSVVHHEMVLDKFGDTVELGYRYSTLRRSGENERIAAKEMIKEQNQESKLEFNKKKIFDLIDTMQEPTKTNVAMAAGKKQFNMELIEGMISTGELLFVDSGKKALNNRPIFVLKRGL